MNSSIFSFHFHFFVSIPVYIVYSNIIYCNKIHQYALNSRSEVDYNKLIYIRKSVYTVREGFKNSTSENQ